MKNSGTFLTHQGCGGAVILDVSQSAKLVSPVFGVNTDGIGNILLDIQLPTDNLIIPRWTCSKCRQDISNESLPDTVVCVCQACSETKPVRNIKVQGGVSAICDDCLDEIKTRRSKGALGSDGESDVARFAYVFAIGERSKAQNLAEVLVKPISIS